MNERIRELAIECTDWVTGSLDGDHEVFDKERFAELIIKECYKVSANALYDGNVPHHTIKKHFGVEL